MGSITEADRDRAQKDWVKAHPGQTPDENAINGQVYQNFYDQAFNATGLGTGGAVQQGIQAATAVVQGLAGGDIASAIAGGMTPYLAEAVGHRTGIDNNPEAKAVAHAIVGAALAAAQGQNAAAGATGAALGEITAGILKDQLYGKDTKIADLTETQKQTLSALSTLSSGLAGGLAGDSTGSAVYAAQAGKTVAENNFLGNSSSEKLDKAVEKIKQGDKSLAAANELITLENADRRSDALVSKFTKGPSQMNSMEHAELAGYLRVYASEMEKEHGPAIAQELVTALLSGQDYIKRNPDSEAMSKAQAIINTWGYHKSNASIGDAPLLFGGSVLGLTVKGMAANAAIGVGVNVGVQLTGKDPFSYVDTIMAGVTAAATTGKGVIVSAPINMGGAAIGSGIKGEDPTNSTIGAGLGSVAGGIAGKIASKVTKPIVKETTYKVSEAAIGAITSEVTGNKVKEQLAHEGKNNEIQ